MAYSQTEACMVRRVRAAIQDGVKEFTAEQGEIYILALYGDGNGLPWTDWSLRKKFHIKGIVQIEHAIVRVAKWIARDEAARAVIDPGTALRDEREKDRCEITLKRNGDTDTITDQTAQRAIGKELWGNS